jgi:hypothetical protein
VKLPTECLDALDRASTFSFFALGKAVVRKLVAKLSGQEPFDYLAVAARRIHEVLERFHASVPVYVLGHTHNARQEWLSVTGTGALYLNTGTWSSDVRGGVASEHRGRWFTYVRVRPREGAFPTWASICWEEADASLARTPYVDRRLDR